MSSIKSFSLSNEEKELLIDSLFSQKYVIEVISSMISDLENQAVMDEEKLKKLSVLFDRLKENGF
ncbi:antirepressor AbbA [Bacillus taeanensis]|uniref:Antirepressor AbbA n=1 Tax=Bacillus taeanensis TaxID=273032 RepID=A0A366Y4R7_9BACI|nr:antirepressor AbbA [Bacillus taeanensis]RBW71384.1 antirepressor AbbA [Bacillus taeanensis]